MKLSLPKQSTDPFRNDPSDDSIDVIPASETINTEIGSAPVTLGHAGRLTSRRNVPIPVRNPHADDQRFSEYLLVCEAHAQSITRGSWRFTLETVDGTQILDAEDEDAGDLNRLTLLAAVRGLESIEGSSSVTLLSNNRYLIRSLSDSLPRWRQNNFVWDHFGRRIDVQHADLWRRIDRALQIHRVEACLVSTRLVSSGSDESESDELSNRSKGGEINRVDSPHNGNPPRPHLSGPSIGDQGQPSGDRLRRLLMGGAARSSSTPPPPGFASTGVERAGRKRRFTSEDLMNQG